MDELHKHLSPEQLKEITFSGSLLLAEGFVREGLLDLTIVSDTDLPGKINELVRDNFIRGDHPLGLTFDHTKELIDLAEQAEEKGDVELTCLFYMLVIEHRVNRFVRSILRRRKMDDKDAVQIVRKLSVREKFSWLFTFLNIPALAEDLATVLGTIEEYRNSFVHFKWIEMYQKEDPTWQAIQRVDEIIEWLDRIDEEYIFLNQKARLVVACEKIATPDR